MAAPTFTLRQSPGGRRLEDGYQIFICFANDPDISLWERTIKPPGVDMGDPIDITTQHNESVVTKAMQALADFTDLTFTAGYDPQVLDQILAQKGVEQAISMYFSDGSGWAFFGALRSFEPNEQSRGQFPEASVTITITNSDPSDGSEQVPVYDSNAGSGNP